MNKELTLKHLAPYLPYELKIKTSIHGWGNNIGKSHYRIDKMTDKSIIDLLVSRNRKIILRPLSDLTKKIEHNNKKFVPFHYLGGDFEDDDYYEKQKKGTYNYETKHWAFRNVQKLFEWHFDVFGLIEKGIAIDFNRVHL